MNLKKKLMIYLMTVVAAIVVTVGSASACTMIYVGSDNTADGSTYLARSEDYSNSYNKIAYVSKAGENPAGSVYEGCYGFKHTFSHDSYAYTAVRDDNLAGTCPNCGQSHKHSPMEECGSNEKGVSVSAMVTLSWNGKYRSVDPMVNGGMCESDMTTILLGEASSAKEGVDLLLNIYDTVGAEERSGVLIADKNEAWYVENYTGHEYIAVKLSQSMIAISPNMGAIGLVDLDDAQNVIASKNVIAAAQKAGCYVGSAEDNTIDFRASYSNTSINSRMINGLNYLAGENKFSSGNTTSADFTISNVKDGKIVTLYTPIKANRALTTADMVDFYKVKDIGNTGNLEWHIFQIRSGAKTETATVEWLGIENGQYSVAIPYYPVITTDMYEGYMVGGLGRATTSLVAPENMYGAFPSGVGYKVLPNGWDKGMYWSTDALSNYCLSSKCSDEDNAMVKANIAKMQQKCYDKFAEMEGKIGAMDIDAAKAYATGESAALAKEAHGLTLELYKHLVCDEHKNIFVNAKAASCSEAGYTGDEVCEFCGKVFETGKTVDKLQHSYKETLVDPAIEAKGYTLHTCSVCGDSYMDSFTVAAPQMTAIKTYVTTGHPHMTWTAVDGAQKYIVYRAIGKSGEFHKWFITENNYCTNLSAKPGVTYSYKVVAVSEDGAESEFSNAMGITCTCAQPVVGYAKLGSKTLKPYLSWKAVDGAKNYVVYRSTSADGKYVEMFTTANTHYTNLSAKSGNTYYYKIVAVCAKNSAASSAASNPVSVSLK